jgi:hypothetical protein
MNGDSIILHTRQPYILFLQYQKGPNKANFHITAGIQGILKIVDNKLISTDQFIRKDIDLFNQSNVNAVDSFESWLNKLPYDGER